MERKTVNTKNKIPFEFITDYLASAKIKPMFGCFGVYVAGKMFFLLRNRKEKTELNGVWVTTTIENVVWFSKTFSSVNKDLKLVKDKKTGGTWLLMCCTADSFESDVIKVCELIIKGDKRIGKVTKRSLTTK